MPFVAKQCHRMYARRKSPECVCKFTMKIVKLQTHNRSASELKCEHETYGDETYKEAQRSWSIQHCHMVVSLHMKLHRNDYSEDFNNRSQILCFVFLNLAFIKYVYLAFTADMTVLRCVSCNQLSYVPKGRSCTIHVSTICLNYLEGAVC